MTQLPKMTTQIPKEIQTISYFQRLPQEWEPITKSQRRLRTELKRRVVTSSHHISYNLHPDVYSLRENLKYLVDSFFIVLQITFFIRIKYRNPVPPISDFTYAPDLFSIPEPVQAREFFNLLLLSATPHSTKTLFFI